MQYQTVESASTVLRVGARARGPSHRNGRATHITIAHPFKDLFDAPLQVGDWLACVIQDGELEKALRRRRAEWPIIDTS